MEFDLALIGALSLIWLTGLGFGFKIGYLLKVSHSVITGG